MKDLEQNPTIKNSIEKATHKGDVADVNYLKGFYAAAKYTIWLYNTFEVGNNLKPDHVFMNWSRDGQPFKEK